MKQTKSAPQACRACRRLKRKCTKELPSCSLCIRLGKDCQYPPRPKAAEPEELDRESLITRVRQLEDRLDHGEHYFDDGQRAADAVPLRASAPLNFPSALFLDPDFLVQLPQSAPPSGRPVPLGIMGLIGDDLISVCHQYFLTTHVWFPFVSQKRVYQRLDGAVDSSLALLVLCMKLVSEQEISVPPADSVLYRSAKRLFTTLECTMVVSVGLLQSLVMIALYEIGHGIFPSAYLTVGHAARVGIMMGLHCRNPQNTTQLYKPADAWTPREEERRLWWAIFVLDRYLGLGPKGFPLATPEPCRGDLLPSDDIRWNAGEIGPSEPVFTSGFSTEAKLGLFARTCQSAHMLGRILKHRDEEELDGSARLEEALQLHSILTALDTHLMRKLTSDDKPIATQCAVDLALCCSARLTLYNLYGCNEPDSRDRVPQESEMQVLALEGIRFIASNRIPSLAQRILQYNDADLGSVSPLILQALYHAATEAQWFIREGSWPEMEPALELITAALQLLSRRWNVASMYIELLGSSAA